jgi:hypothetical protein
VTGLLCVRETRKPFTVSTGTVPARTGRIARPLQRETGASHPCCPPERSEGPVSWTFCAKARHPRSPGSERGPGTACINGLVTRARLEPGHRRRTKGRVLTPAAFRADPTALMQPVREERLRLIAPTELIGKEKPTLRF